MPYYDNRGGLVPSEVSSGGRRLYDEQDVRRLSGHIGHFVLI